MKEKVGLTWQLCCFHAVFSNVTYQVGWLLAPLSLKSHEPWPWIYLDANPGFGGLFNTIGLYAFLLPFSVFFVGLLASFPIIWAAQGVLLLFDWIPKIGRNFLGRSPVEPLDTDHKWLMADLEKRRLARIERQNFDPRVASFRQRVRYQGPRYGYSAFTSIVGTFMEVFVLPA